MAILFIFLSSIVCIYFNTCYPADPTGGTKLPYNLYIDAITESPEYDEDLDYIKLQSTNIKSKISRI
jgi:hypothetical protein